MATRCPLSTNPSTDCLKLNAQGLLFGGGCTRSTSVFVAFPAVASTTVAEQASLWVAAHFARPREKSPFASRFSLRSAAKLVTEMLAINVVRMTKFHTVS